jgi:cytochrome c1
MRDGQMREGVPILFDEVTPSVARGSRPAMSFEDVKHMTEVADTSALDGRKDIVFARLQPKIFTSNANSPHDWFRDLPPDIFAMSDAQRLAQPANVSAVFKRCFFLHLPACVIPQAVRDAHQIASRDALSALIMQPAGPPMA